MKLLKYMLGVRSYFALMVVSSLLVSSPGFASSIFAEGTISATTSVFAAGGNGSIFEYPSGAGVQTLGINIEALELAGPEVILKFNASGHTNCCGSNPSSPPDGSLGNNLIQALDGVSGIFGNSRMALLGVFTDGTQPGTNPAALPDFNAGAPESLAPLLFQTFYIGDGRSGYIDPAGSLLSFTAPLGAKMLYLGFADAYTFNGQPAFYGDNTGSLDYTVISHYSVSEPVSLSLLLMGMVVFMVIRKRQR